MTENRSRARKVTRKAAPPSADTTAADVTATFNDGGQAAPSNQDGDSNADSDNKANQGGNSNDEGGNGGNNRNRSRRSRGRGGNQGGNQGGQNNSGNQGGRNRGGQGNKGGQGDKGGQGGRNRAGRGGNRNQGGNQGDRRRNAMQTMQGADLTQRLPKPPAAPKDGVRIVALGGISEIGRNMTVFEYHNRLLIVDCGVLFPSSG